MTTDKPDYCPGQTAVITASGFDVGETVRFHVTRTDELPDAARGDGPWEVTDGGAGDLDGLANGIIQTTWLVYPDYLGSALKVKAKGESSGLRATATFRDDLFDGQFLSRQSGNWNDSQTWIEGLAGMIAATSGDTHVTAYDVNFAELSVGDTLLLQDQDLTVLGTIAGIGQGEFWLTSGAPLDFTGAFGKEAAPVSNQYGFTVCHSVAVTQNLTIQDTIIVLQGDLSVSSGFTLNVEAALTNIGGTVSVDGILNFSSGSASTWMWYAGLGVAEGGTANISGTIEASGSNTWWTVDGSVNVSGSVSYISSVQVDGTMSISGSLDATGLTIRGSVEVTGSGALMAAGTGYVDGIFVTGTLRVSGTSQIGDASFATIVVVDGGTLDLGAETLLYGFDFRFDSGTLIIGSADGISADGTSGNIRTSEYYRPTFAPGANGGTTLVQFDIPETDSGYDDGFWTILTSGLPTIDTTVVIDARTQDGFNFETGVPVIILSGGGLEFTRESSGLAGMAIVDFGDSGISFVEAEEAIAAQCYIGVDPAGGEAQGGTDGVLICDSSKGFYTNLVVGNADVGVHITGEGAALNMVLWSLIGSDGPGKGGPNGEGVLLDDGANLNLIMGNTISGNSGNGIHMSGSGVVGNSLKGNVIGDLSSYTLGNGGKGVLIDEGASQNTIGMSVADNFDTRDGARQNPDANVIAHNGCPTASPGVVVLGDGTGNTIRGNRIFSNGGNAIPIDLGGDGPTINNSHIPGTGPNNYQQQPYLIGSRPTGINAQYWALNGAPGERYTVDFYGEDGRYVYSQVATIGPDRFAFFTQRRPDSGDAMTVTATDAQGNTSEVFDMNSPPDGNATFLAQSGVVGFRPTDQFGPNAGVAIETSIQVLQYAQGTTFVRVTMAKGEKYGEYTADLPNRELISVLDGKAGWDYLGQDMDSAQIAVGWRNPTACGAASNALDERDVRVSAWRQADDGTVYWDILIPDGMTSVSIRAIYTDVKDTPTDIPAMLGTFEATLVEGSWVVTENSPLVKGETDVRNDIYNASNCLLTITHRTCAAPGTDTGYDITRI
ncbi:MAG: right-handed parallel beta-helix repeat-containing protein [Phycisphaerae bacterium]